MPSAVIKAECPGPPFVAVSSTRQVALAASTSAPYTKEHTSSFLHSPAPPFKQTGPCCCEDIVHQGMRLKSDAVDRSPPPPPVRSPPPASPAPTPPATLAAGGKYAPGQVIWADEFSGFSGATSGIDPAKWNFQNGDGSYWGIKGAAPLLSWRWQIALCTRLARPGWRQSLQRPGAASTSACCASAMLGKC